LLLGALSADHSQTFQDVSDTGKTTSPPIFTDAILGNPMTRSTREQPWASYSPGSRCRNGCTCRSLTTISVAAASDITSRNPLLK